MINLLLSLSIMTIILTEEIDNKTQEIPQDKKDLYMDKMPMEVMDKLMLCYYVTSESLYKERDLLNKTAIRCNKTFEEMQYKVSYEKLHNCYSNITKEMTEKYIKNLESIKYPRTEELYNYTKTDYESYTNESRYSLTIEETMTGYNLQKAKEKFEAHQRDLYRDNKSKDSLSIAGLDFNKINPNYKIIFFLVMVSLFTFGIIYLLGVVSKKENKKKKKKN